MSERPCPQRGRDRIRPYGPGKPIDEVKREYGIEDVVKLASNENPLGVSPKALDAMNEALPHLNLYPDSASYDLRQSLAAHLGFPMGQIAVGNGADDLIFQISMAYFEDGDEVIVSRSSFPMYDVYIHAMRAVVVKTPLAQDYRIDLRAMADAINERTKLVHVCNPNNPTGTIVLAREVDAFLERVPDDVLVVFDEAYVDMVDSDAFPDSLSLVREGRSNILVLRTFSKMYGLAGIRLGYVVGNEEAVATLCKIKPPFTVNALAQVAGIAALQDTEFLKRSVEANKKGRVYLSRELRRLGLEHAERHTNFVLVRIGPAASDVQQKLLETGVIVRPCSGYDLPEFLRISIGTPEQNERLVRELERMLSEAEGLGITRILAHISSRNPGSIAFHRKHGFVECGRFPEIGQKRGELFDIVWMVRSLNQTLRAE